MIIEVRQASAASIGFTGPDGPLLAVRSASAPSGVVAFQNQGFSSQFGCPSTWRVRVRAAIGPDVLDRHEFAEVDYTFGSQDVAFTADGGVVAVGR